MKAMTSDINRRYPSAEAMIADLEAFRKNPGVSLDFELSDLRGADVDEPTQPLGAAAAQAVGVVASRQVTLRSRRNPNGESLFAVSMKNLHRNVRPIRRY